MKSSTIRAIIIYPTNHIIIIRHYTTRPFTPSTLSPRNNYKVPLSKYVVSIIIYFWIIWLLWKISRSALKTEVKCTHIWSNTARPTLTRQTVGKRSSTDNEMKLRHRALYVTTSLTHLNSELVGGGKTISEVQSHRPSANKRDHEATTFCLTTKTHQKKACCN